MSSSSPARDPENGLDALAKRVLGLRDEDASPDQMVRRIIQSRMRTRLDSHDGREITERAWDCYQTVSMEIVQELHAIDAGIQSRPNDFRKWLSARVWNTISDEFRRGNPNRARLKSRLRWFLKSKPRPGWQPTFALWPDSEDPQHPAGARFWAGFAKWEGRRRHLASAIQFETLTRQPVKPLELMKSEDWEKLLTAVFDELDRPVMLDALVRILVPWFGFKEGKGGRRSDGDDPAPEPRPAPGPSPERRALNRAWLEWVWRTSASFDRRWLIAFFLNLPRDNKTKEPGEIQVFPALGISISQIGRRLELSAADYQILRKEIGDEPPPLPEDLATPELRFAAIWGHIPLRDDHIGALLGITRQQVANLRITMLARLRSSAAGNLKARPTPALNGGAD